MSPLQRFALILGLFLVCWLVLAGILDAAIDQAHGACIQRNCHSDHNTEVCECE